MFRTNLIFGVTGTWWRHSDCSLFNKRRFNRCEMQTCMKKKCSLYTVCLVRGGYKVYRPPCWLHHVQWCKYSQSSRENGWKNERRRQSFWEARKEEKAYASGEVFECTFSLSIVYLKNLYNTFVKTDLVEDKSRLTTSSARNKNFSMCQWSTYQQMQRVKPF